ncbi:MAG: Asp23/Gls24 family envelope stress response protein [Lentisphaeria bacterium]|nr:Asp23/Gls24 family envelope stress response protein [Lentisphaeria bacterium]
MKQNESEKAACCAFSGGESASKGVVKVHESVIASIIRKAACSVEGVIRLAGNTLVDNLAELVGSKKVMDRAISIEMGDNTVEVTIEVVIQFGCRIPEVAEKIQDAVIAEIARITGMKVPRVDIIVSDLEDAADEEEPAEAEGGPEAE